jgi:glycosyltransferase involved in cell wall biosynthesis
MESSAIQILLACHNSQAFLGALLDSIGRQSFANWQLLVRDDGSTDQTLRILRGFGERMILLPDRRAAGACGSFAGLLRASTAPYVMFCDHDDVWLAGKIERTLERMKQAEERFGREMPLLVFTDLQVVDRNLAMLGASYYRYHHVDPQRTALRQLLRQNVAVGCTLMLNRPLVRLMQSIPSQAIMHDHWTALTAAAFGKIFYLPEATLLYRQHGGNAMGVQPWSFGRILRRVMSRQEGQVDFLRHINQARAFLKYFDGRLSGEERETLRAFVSLPEQSFLRQRATVIRHGFLKSGLLRNAGLLAGI